MKILKRLVIVVLSLFLLIVIGLFIFLQTTKPQYSGELKVSGVQQPTDIFFDEYGVPHIYAKNLEDAYFALGYVHAQDRLFQMEMLRRAAGGRLSEILGADLLPVDKLFRTLGFNQFAEENASRYLNTDSLPYQRAALAYQRGINQFIDHGKTPLEFSLIGIPKTHFSTKDIYLAIAFMSFGFAEGLQTDPVLEKIKNEYGAAYLKDFAIDTPDDAVRLPIHRGEPKEHITDTLIAFVQTALERIPIPRWQGSNGWVVSGDRTASGYPILANDTHIGYGQPAVWYEAHLEFPGHSFYGHYAAGIPFGLLGNNRFSGWGLTMFENDDTDFFYETIHPDNPLQVKFKDAWEALNVSHDTIRVKDAEDVFITIKKSRHGAIINGVLDIEENAPAISLAWTLTAVPSEALQALYQLNHATNFPEVQKAASMISAPGLNIMYGDRDGNIAWWAVAKLPIRPAHVHSKLFLDGASGKDEYLGYYDFKQNPQSINPPRGYVYTTNNQPDSVDGVLYPGYYFPKNRAQRVISHLDQQKKWTAEDMKTISLDILSPAHVEVSQELASQLSALHKPAYEEIIDILKNWDGDHQPNDIAPSVYYNLLSQLIYLTVKDELGTAATKNLMESSILKNSYLRLLQNESSPWWDNVHTTPKETRADILHQAAENTLRNLHKTSGKQSEYWAWKKIHTLTHAHPLGSVKPLHLIFNVGPFESPGGSEVLNNLSHVLDTTGYFPVTSGPALRKITDFENVEHGQTISPTGQSGNRMSQYYSDQAKMFIQGEFRSMLMNRKAIDESAKGKKLTLIPAP
jgi:penicillin amidase